MAVVASIIMMIRIIMVIMVKLSIMKVTLMKHYNKEKVPPLKDLLTSKRRKLL